MKKPGLPFLWSTLPTNITLRRWKNNFWQKKQAYIIDLGNNDIYFYHQQIGTAEDIHPDNPSLNPDTYFGYLGKVISKLKSLEKDAFIFLVSMQIDHLSKEKDETSRYVTKELEKRVKASATASATA